MSARNVISVLVASTCVGTFAVSGAPAPARPPARMLVYAQEWSLWPSRGTLPAGRLTVQLWNRGEDAHDLRIKRLDKHGRMTGQSQGLAATQSGAIGEASWRLGRGRYELYCSMPGHRDRGMRVRLLAR
jgi:hypothetical protein